MLSQSSSCGWLLTLTKVGTHWFRVLTTLLCSFNCTKLCAHNAASPTLVEKLCLVAVLARFLPSLNRFVKERYNIVFALSDYSVYEFHRVRSAVRPALHGRLCMLDDASSSVKSSPQPCSDIVCPCHRSGDAIVTQPEILFMTSLVQSTLFMASDPFLVSPVCMCTALLCVCFCTACKHHKIGHWLSLPCSSLSFQYYGVGASSSGLSVHAQQIAVGSS